MNSSEKTGEKTVYGAAVSGGNTPDSPGWRIGMRPLDSVDNRCGKGAADARLIRERNESPAIGADRLKGRSLAVELALGHLVRFGPKLKTLVASINAGFPSHERAERPADFRAISEHQDAAATEPGAFLGRSAAQNDDAAQTRKPRGDVQQGFQCRRPGVAHQSQNAGAPGLHDRLDRLDRRVRFPNNQQY